MSIADRFPDYDLTLPDWFMNAPDDIDNPADLAELARQSAADDLEALRRKIGDAA